MIRFTVFCFIIMRIFAADKKPTLGPFKTITEKIQDCEKTTRAQLKDSPMLFETLVRNTTRGPNVEVNFTIVRDVYNVELKITTLSFKNGAWIVHHAINIRNCQGLLIRVIQNFMNLLYDKKACAYLKGKYVFKNFDVNELEHSWKKSSLYGKSMTRVEAMVSTGTMFCKEFVNIIVPA